MSIATRALAALALLAPLALAQDERKGGQELVDGALYDHDYSFVLRAADEGWALQDEDAIRAFVPDAVAGAIRAPQLFCALVAERLPNTEVVDFARLLLDGMPVENKQVVEFEEIEYLGLPGVRFLMSGRIEGVNVLYLNTVFVRDDWAFQLLAWTVEGMGLGREALIAPSENFELLEPAPRARSAVPGPRNAHGASWRVREGVFESAAFGFGVEPPEGWTLLVGERLELLNPDGYFGLYHQESECYLVCIAEAVVGAEEENFLNYLRGGIAFNLGRAPLEDELVFEAAGKPRSFLDFGDVGVSGVGLRHLHTAWIEGSNCLQLIAWHPTSLASEAEAVLGEATSAVYLLEEAARIELAAALAELPDRDLHIGPGSSLRGGVYRDFELGLTWAEPRGPMWDTRAGQLVRQFNPMARMQFVSDPTGLAGQLLAEASFGYENEEYHELVVQPLLELPQAKVLEETRAFDSWGVPAQTTSVTAVVDGLELSWAVATTVYEGIALQWLVWGSFSNLSHHAAEVESARDALRVNRAGLPMTRVEGGRFYDDRLGYSLSMGEGASAIEDITPPQIRALGGVVTYESGENRVIAMAMWSPQLGHTEEHADFVAELFAGAFPERAREAEYETSASELAGRPATRLVFKDEGDGVEARFITEGGRLFALCVAGPSSTEAYDPTQLEILP